MCTDGAFSLDGSEGSCTHVRTHVSMHGTARHGMAWPCTAEEGILWLDLRSLRSVHTDYSSLKALTVRACVHRVEMHTDMR